jgi:hypothetical protein
MIYDSLESPYHAASNRIISMYLALMDKKLLIFYCFETFANNFLSINAKGIKTV